MRSKKITNLAGSVLIGLLPSMGLTYDKNDNWLVKENLERIIDSSVQIQTYGTVEKQDEMDFYFFKVPNGKSKIGMRTLGSGTVLFDKEAKNQYVLTCAHILPENSKDNSIYVNGIEMYVAKIDVDNDLMLLFPQQHINDAKPFSGSFAEDSEIGDYVIGVGYPGVGLGKKIWYGHITNPDLQGSLLAEGMMYPGQSGGGVYTFDMGEPKLVGLNEFKVIGKDGINGLVSPKTIKRFLINTPLANDYY